MQDKFEELVKEELANLGGLHGAKSANAMDKALKTFYETLNPEEIIEEGLCPNPWCPTN